MKPKHISILVIALFCLIGKIYAQDLSKITSGGKLNSLQAIIDIRHYTINLEVDIDKKYVSGHTAIELTLLQPTDTLLFDLVSSYQINQILVDEQPQKFVHKNHQILIVSNKKFTPNTHLIKIFYEGNPPLAVRPPWEGGFTWATDKQNNPFVSLNCQLQGAKLFFPCKDHPSDEPNEGAELFITLPNHLSVAGFGLLQSVKPAKNNKATWHWKTNYTISNYCILFNIGKYKVFNRNYTTCEGNTVPIQLYILEQDTAQAQKLLAIKERDTRILEKYFGEYPWVKEKIGIVEVPNSGMEHQTMITFQDGLKLRSIAGNLEYSDVYFHEYAHEWWANKITNKDWAHMWIQEGITTYAEALAMRELGGEEAYDAKILNYRYAISANGNKKPLVFANEATMKEVYSGDLYHKGAMLMHALRYVLGDEVFFPALKKFSVNVRYPYNQFFVSDDVEQFFSKEAGKDLKPIFDFYLKTTKEIEINVFQKDTENYSISINNAPLETLPLDIVTDSGIIHTTMTATKEKPLLIKSKTMPIIDPRGWYFRKVVYH